MYQQGRDWYVSGVTVWSHNTGNDPMIFSFGTLPDTWTVRNAYKRGREAYNRMMKEAVINNPDFIRPKWNDFKVRMYTDEQISDQGVTIRPDWSLVDSHGIPYYWHDDDMDYQYSTFCSQTTDDSETDEFQAAMLGDHDGSQGDYDGFVGLVRSYNDTLQPVADPNPSEMIEPADPILGLMASSDFAQDVIEEVQTEGDLPPYAPLLAAYGTGRNATYASNSIIQASTCIDSGSGQYLARAQGFKAPLGMVEIVITPPETELLSGTGDYFVTFHMTPGDTRGYHTTPIQ